MLLPAVTVLAVLSSSACGVVGPGAGGRASESSPPALAAMEGAAPIPPLILEANNDRPAPLPGNWSVVAGDRTCRLTLQIDDRQLTGSAEGCSAEGETWPIAIGLVSGESFLFQTGRGVDGWIWSGRYDRATNLLEGRRENVITGKLESFVARR